jgi:hypothetical protein
MAASALSADPLVLDASLYPDDCVRSAVAAYQPYAEVAIEQREGPELLISILSKAPASDHIVRREFLNYVLDLSLRQHLAGE